jgi:hypothetical protein
MRNNFIEEARTGDNDKGNKGYYWFNVMPKINKPDEENPKRTEATRALMNTIFQNPKYRVIALRIYEILVHRMLANPFIRLHYQTNLVVMLKGGTAYTYMVGYSDETFPYSDLDLVICINPFLEEALFKQIKDSVNIIVLQTISQYKRSIDYMFFSGARDHMTPEQHQRHSNDMMLPPHLLEEFKEDYIRALSAIKIDGVEGSFYAPFESTEIRNAASKHSFIITPSVAQTDAVVRVEVPHYEMCERIPLRRTPMVTSHNRTIDFNRSSKDGEMLKGCFDLYRLRLNNLFVPDEQKDENRVHRESVMADFIDISIPSQNDIELIEFWQKGRTVMVKDICMDLWIVIPHIHVMVDELYKMMSVYECPEAKREKRQKRYEALKSLMY